SAVGGEGVFESPHAASVREAAVHANGAHGLRGREPAGVGISARCLMSCLCGPGGLSSGSTMMIDRGGSRVDPILNAPKIVTAYERLFVPGASRGEVPASAGIRDGRLQRVPIGMRESTSHPLAS